MPPASGTTPPAKHSDQVMRTIEETAERNPPNARPYALRRGVGFWEVIFEGQHATFRHEQGAPYAAWLLLQPPPKPLHAVVLALEARALFGHIPDAAVIQQQYLGLAEAEAVRTLRRRERELEAVLDDEDEIEPVKAEAQRELAAMADFMRQNPWHSRECAEKCARAVRRSIQLLVAHLAGAVDAGGNLQP